MKKFNYENTQYLQRLGELPPEFYAKYIFSIKRYCKTKESLFLDVGCGNGFVLSSLKKQGYQNGYGVDVSKLFISDAKKHGLRHLYQYSGKKFPFKNNYFDFVGSFTVLEHTEDPESFLREQLRILKIGGYLLVACPNFLSVVMMSPHPRIKGPVNRIRNFLRLCIRLFTPTTKFERMKLIQRAVFQSDDDAIVVTNLLDLRRVLKRMNCSIIYESGFLQSSSKLTRFIDALPLVKYAMPSCFVVVRKN